MKQFGGCYAGGREEEVDTRGLRRHRQDWPLFKIEVPNKYGGKSSVRAGRQRGVGSLLLNSHSLICVNKAPF